MPFVSVDNVMRLVNAVGVERFLSEFAGFIAEEAKKPEITLISTG